MGGNHQHTLDFLTAVYLLEDPLRLPPLRDPPLRLPPLRPLVPPLLQDDANGRSLYRLLWLFHRTPHPRRAPYAPIIAQNGETVK